MNKLMIYTVLFVAMVFSASAACVGNVQVHAVDSNGKNLPGVLVAPEWKFSFTGWNDFAPKQKITDAKGLANACLWIGVNNELLQVNHATLDEYTCTQGADTRIVAKHGVNTLKVICTQDNTVPEFGIIAGVVALVGLVAGVVVLRKKQ